LVNSVMIMGSVKQCRRAHAQRKIFQT
jgi:hypothetical protein